MASFRDIKPTQPLKSALEKNKGQAAIRSEEALVADAQSFTSSKPPKPIGIAKAAKPAKAAGKSKAKEIKAENAILREEQTTAGKRRLPRDEAGKRGQ